MTTPMQETNWVAFVEEHGSIEAAAQAAGCTYVAMKHRRGKQLRRAARGALGYKLGLPGMAIKSIAAPVDGVWVKETKSAGEPFELRQGEKFKEGSYLLNGADDTVIVKWVKTEKDRAIAAFSVDAIKEALSEIKPRLPIARPLTCYADLLTDYVLGDHHLRMLAWPKETLGDAYDLKIAEEMLIHKIDELVACAPPSETGIFSNLGDFFHSNSDGETTKGTKTDNDGRYGKALQVGLRLAVACVEKMLTKHMRVIINWLLGNHDEEVALGVALALWAWFRNDPRVEINFNPSKFFMHEHGKTMLFSTHGDKLKPTDAVEFVASQYAEAWGRTTKRYAKFGHVHHKATGGTAGKLSWESFETLAPKDAWHAGEGYQADRSMTAITYHNVTGEWSRNRVSV